MSLRSMAVMRADAESAAAGGGGDRTKPPAPLDKFRDQLIALVPAEAVGVYVAAIGAAAEAPEWVRWVCFGVVLVLTVGWVTLNYWQRAGGRTRVPWLEVIVGVVAFVAWTTTVPKGTLSDLGVDTWVGTLIVVFTSVVLTMVVQAKALWATKAPIDRVVEKTA